MIIPSALFGPRWEVGPFSEKSLARYPVRCLDICLSRWLITPAMFVFVIVRSSWVSDPICLIGHPSKHPTMETRYKTVQYNTMTSVEHRANMMTSSNENIFRVTGPLWGESPVTDGFPSQRPVTRSFDVFFDLRLSIRLRIAQIETPRVWDAIALVMTSLSWIFNSKQTSDVQLRRTTLLTSQGTSNSTIFLFNSLVQLTLTHWGRDKMAAIFQTTFSNGFSWMKL